MNFCPHLPTSPRAKEFKFGSKIFLIAAPAAALSLAAAPAHSQSPPPEPDFGIPQPMPSAPMIPSPAPQPSPPETGSGAILKQFDAAFSAIFETASPSVVVIRVDKEDLDTNAPGEIGDPFSGNPEGFGFGPLQNEGSGFILDDLGHILTNLHVIDGAKKIRVRLKDGRDFIAKKIGVDDKTDIAVIKIEATGLVPSRLADSDKLRIGQLVATIGAPYNLDYSFTLGIISGLGRTNFNVAAFEEYIQTDASINPGNSGGPLLDVDGRVIGMTTLVNGINRGLGFAIPINMAREVAAELIKNGRIRRPWLGLGIDNFSDVIGKSEKNPGLTSGVVIRSIAIESPAYRTDLRAGDVIVAVEGKAVRTTRELQKLVLAKQIGEQIPLTVNRKGKILDVTITTAELPETGNIETTPKGSGKPSGTAPKKDDRKLVKPDMPSANGPGAEKAPSSPSAPDSNSIGIELQSLSSADAARLGLPDDGGLIVKAVVSGLPAAMANLAKDDVIVAVGSTPVRTPEEFWSLLGSNDLSKGVTLTVVRSGKRSVTTLSLPRPR